MALAHASAHMHDNAERLLERARELRIVVADREVPPDALAGIALPLLARMAKEHKVRGLLLQLDPDEPKGLAVTVLDAPGGARLSANGRYPIKRFAIAHHRVSGELEHPEYSVRFSAPLFFEPPVTADLRGRAARDSPQARALREKARALARGDPGARQAAADLERSLQRLQRVVVRAERAVAIFGKGEWANFAREAGEWRSAD